MSPVSAIPYAIVAGTVFFLSCPQSRQFQMARKKADGKHASAAAAAPVAKVPKNWPSNITYLTTPRYSKALTAADYAAFRPARPCESSSTASPPPSQQPGLVLPQIPNQTPNPPVSITRITRPSHPAHTQYGLFATHDLAPGSFILPYVGVVHAAGADADPGSDYDLCLDGGRGIGVDATRAGNQARFVNDYRGVRARPNAEFRECVTRGGERTMGVWVVSAGRSGAGRKGVRRGEEICVSYGKGFWRGRGGQKEEEEEEAEDEKEDGDASAGCADHEGGADGV
ncbi:MAG: hypothetical protein M1819_001041 [Sarea resinae]|nr:MAG: hypothetical protein M1819_001041 [Sarea resinae]